MTTRTPHKLNVTMPTTAVNDGSGLRGAASMQTTVGAGFTAASLAERWKR